MKPFALVALLCLPAFGQAYVNSNSAVSTGASTAATTLIGVGTGHLIVAICGSYDSPSPTISHTATGTFTQASQYDSFGVITTWYLLNTASGNDTITCHASSLQTIHIHAYEFSGLATSSVLDQANSQDDSVDGTKAVSVSTSGATTVANEIVSAGFFNPGNIIGQSGTSGQNAVVSLTQCTLKENTVDSAGATGALSTAYAVATSTGTKTCSGTVSVGSQDYYTAISTYKQAAGAPSSSKTLLILGIGEE